MLVRLACVMGKSVMGGSKLILILLALFCGRALCTSEVGGNMCEENLVMNVQDKHAKLGFYRCDGESVTTTIKVDRSTSKDPSLVIDVSVNEFEYVSYLCGVDYMSSIEDNGRILGYVDFSENCNQALIVFNPPPAIGARITIHIDNGTDQRDYGPYFIGQEGIMFLPESCGGNLILWLTKLTHCKPGMPPYNVNVAFGNNTLILWKNGTTTSMLEPECISVDPLTCQANGTMAELRLYLNASVEGCQNSTPSTVVAKYDDVIQRQTSVNSTACTMPKDQSTPTSIGEIVIPVTVFVAIIIIAIIITAIIAAIVMYCRKKSHKEPASDGAGSENEETPRNGVPDQANPIEDPSRNGADQENPIDKSQPEKGQRGGAALLGRTKHDPSNPNIALDRKTDTSNGSERCGTDNATVDPNEPAETLNMADTEGF